MITIYQLKPKFQNSLRPIVKGLAGFGVTANQVTILACFISILLGVYLFAYHERQEVFFLLPPWMFVRMALNAIDGMLAREFNMKSALGGILNELTDVISDTALYLPFAAVYGRGHLLLILVVIFSILTEFTGLAAVQIGASRRYDGPMGKSDRAFVFGAIALAIACGVPIAEWLSYTFGFILLLLVLTIFNRAQLALKELGENARSGR